MKWSPEALARSCLTSMASLWLNAASISPPGRWFERLLALDEGQEVAKEVAEGVVRLAQEGHEEEASEQLLRALLSGQRVGVEAFEALMALLSVKGKAEERGFQLVSLALHVV